MSGMQLNIETFTSVVMGMTLSQTALVVYDIIQHSTPDVALQGATGLIDGTDGSGLISNYQPQAASITDWQINNPCEIEIDMTLPDIVRDISDPESITFDLAAGTIEACPSASWLVSPRLLVIRVQNQETGVDV